MQKRKYKYIGRNTRYAIWAKKKRAEETPEQREKRLKHSRERNAARRAALYAAETSEERENRLLHIRVTTAKRRAEKRKQKKKLEETPEEHTNRLMQIAKRKAAECRKKKRLAETAEEREKRLLHNRIAREKRRAAELAAKQIENLEKQIKQSKKEAALHSKEKRLLASAVFARYVDEQTNTLKNLNGLLVDVNQTKASLQMTNLCNSAVNNSSLSLLTSKFICNIKQEPSSHLSSSSSSSFCIFPDSRDARSTTNFTRYIKEEPLPDPCNSFADYSQVNNLQISVPSLETARTALVSSQDIKEESSEVFDSTSNDAFKVINSTNAFRQCTVESSVVNCSKLHTSIDVSTLDLNKGFISKQHSSALNYSHESAVLAPLFANAQSMPQFSSALPIIPQVNSANQLNMSYDNDGENAYPPIPVCMFEESTEIITPD